MKLILLLLSFILSTAAQLTVVGSPCSENTDCRRGGYCDSSKKCDCLSTFTQINSYCWLKVNPGQSGCTHNKQCYALWPNAYCSSGVCRCPNNSPPFDTNDGPVCVNYGFCPVNGDFPKYRQSDGTVTTCALGLNLACPPAHDCFCNQNNCVDFNVVTYCCPSRALACIQQLDVGTTRSGGGSTITRWHYNPVSEACESFGYRGDGGNANNFESRDQCLSYCTQSCDRGRPEYNQYVGTRRFTTIKFCTGANIPDVCGDRHGCDSVGSIRMCCPSTSFICGRSGGIDYTSLGYITPSTDYDPGSTGGYSIRYPRWYYDRANKRCRPFTYNGYGGNFNNFLSEEHCSGFCADVLCSAGVPLKDGTGVVIQSCSGNAGCPAHYECTSSDVCCPRKEYVCSQPQDTGSCGNFVSRWWYNADTGNCEKFTYSGCQGNDNNFSGHSSCTRFCENANSEPRCPRGEGLKDTYGEYVVCGGVATTTSRRTCPSNYICYYDGNVYGCCPTQAFTCSVSYDQGKLCGPTSTRWYFNPERKQCRTFRYFGCDGNSNNFATQTDCQDYCGVLGGCADGGDPVKEPNGQYRICSGGNTCPSTHFCTQVSLGTSSTYNYCCPTRTYICSLQKDSGAVCGDASTRYAFNVGTRSCETFSFFGCEGNRNNFNTLSQCLNYCNSAGCPAGEQALQDSSNNGVRTCSNRNGCPSDYTCKYSSLLGQSVCCGSGASADSCPFGQKAYIDAFTSTPRQCQANVEGSCPAGYICWFSISQNQYYCCGASSVQCPSGRSPYIDSVTNSARQCTPGVVGACPSNFVCQPTPIAVGTVPSITGYCCGNGGVCGVGFESYDLNDQPIACNPNVTTTCPSPFSCNRNPQTNSYYCCRRSSPGNVNVCETYGEVSLLLEGASVVCSTGSARTNCPSPYTCRLYAPTNTFYCCRPRNISTPTPSTQCPPNMNPVRTTADAYMYCSPSTPGNCASSNGICQFDPTQSRYICCSTGRVIVSPTTPRPTATTTTPTPTVTCPDGDFTTNTLCTDATCVRGLSCEDISGRLYCCPVIQRTFVCPSSEAAYANPLTLQPQTCFPGFVFGCPNGFSCQRSPIEPAFYCCPQRNPIRSNSQNTYCPFGQVAYRNPLSNLRLMCNEGGRNSCPTGYSCSRASSGASYCCGSGAAERVDNKEEVLSEGGCPRGSPFVYPGTQFPLGCNKPNERGICPAGFVCRSSMKRPGASQCCSLGRKTNAK